MRRHRLPGSSLVAAKLLLEQQCRKMLFLKKNRQGMRVVHCLTVPVAAKRRKPNINHACIANLEAGRD